MPKTSLFPSSYDIYLLRAIQQFSKFENPNRKSMLKDTLLELISPLERLLTLLPKAFGTITVFTDKCSTLAP